MTTWPMTVNFQHHSMVSCLSPTTKKAGTHESSLVLSGKCPQVRGTGTCQAVTSLMVLLSISTFRDEAGNWRFLNPLAGWQKVTFQAAEEE